MKEMYEAVGGGVVGAGAVIICKLSPSYPAQTIDLLTSFSEEISHSPGELKFAPSPSTWAKPWFGQKQQVSTARSFTFAPPFPCSPILPTHSPPSQLSPLSRDFLHLLEKLSSRRADALLFHPPLLLFHPPVFLR